MISNSKFATNKFQFRVLHYSTISCAFLIFLILHNIVHYSDAYSSTTYRHSAPVNFDYDFDIHNTSWENLSLESQQRPPPIIVNASAKHTGTIIFLHDYGEAGTFYCIKEMQEIRLPSMKVICPNAKKEPVSHHDDTILPSWFNFRNSVYPQEGKDVEHIGISTEYIHSLINSEIEDGIKPNRIILGGVSQGGTLALHAALSYPKRLGAVIALSPFQPEHECLIKNMTSVNKNLPIFQAHVLNEKNTPNEAASMITNYLKEHVSNDIHFKQYKVDIEHQQHLDTPESINDVKAFLKRYFDH